MYKKIVIFAIIIIAIFAAAAVNYFSVDRTATYAGNKLEWKGVSYIEISGEYSEEKTIAKTKDGRWDINEVKEDETHTFVVARSFLDQYLLVREDYKIPKNGRVTSVFVEHSKINKEDFCRAIEKIIVEDGELFTIKTDNIYSKASQICLSYENCPVGTEYVGFIGFINNYWVYITPIKGDIMLNSDGTPREYPVDCKIINEEYVPVIELYIRT